MNAHPFVHAKDRDTVVKKHAQNASFQKPAPLPPSHPFLWLQRSIGNQAVNRIVQAKRSVNPPENEYERRAKEAAVALKQVVSKLNNTGLPDNLKTGIESLSGISMDNVKVHYNSAQPARFSASAYAQGSEIHVAPGQEQHLPHEAWHIVQQAQGRVRPTLRTRDGVPVNDDKGLEHEANVMGARADTNGEHSSKREVRPDRATLVNSIQMAGDRILQRGGTGDEKDKKKEDEKIYEGTATFNSNKGQWQVTSPDGEVLLIEAKPDIVLAVNTAIRYTKVKKNSFLTKAEVFAQGERPAATSEAHEMRKQWKSRTEELRQAKYLEFDNKDVPIELGGKKNESGAWEHFKDKDAVATSAEDVYKLLETNKTIANITFMTEEYDEFKIKLPGEKNMIVGKLEYKKGEKTKLKPSKIVVTHVGPTSSN